MRSTFSNAVCFVATTLCSATPLAAQVATGAIDTIRVGTVALARISDGVDTLDTVLEMAGQSSDAQRRTTVNIARWTTEKLAGQTVLHARFGEVGSAYFDFYVDPRTFMMKRFEQHTPIDSALTTTQDGCVSGWVHLQNEARREITCARTTDRFGSSPIDEHIVARLPLKAGMTAVLATYSPIAAGDDAGYAFRVIGAESLELGSQRYNTWRVERKVVTSYGTYSTTLWVDRDKPRILQSIREFGNGRKVRSVLRNR